MPVFHVMEGAALSAIAPERAARRNDTRAR